MALEVLGRRHLVVHADTLLLEVIFSANKRRFDQSAVIMVQRGATHTQLARNAYPLKVIEAAKFHVADQNYSRSERFSENGHTKSPLAVATADIRASQMLLASVGDFISRTRPSAVEARTRPERARQVARRPSEGGRPIWSRLTRGRRGDMAAGIQENFFF